MTSRGQHEYNGSPADHVARNRLVGTVTALQQIEIAYTHLYSLSRLARYEPMRAFNRATVQTALNEMRYVLAEIRKLR